MIVDCESCHTRFRLDEARIPASGAKVRCSKCKTAFVVKRPQVTLDERVDEVVAEATHPGTSTAPATTEDLFDTSMPATESLGGEPDPAPEEKWEFDEPPRAQAPGGAAPAAAPASPAAAPSAGGASASGADDLDALGSPDEWDFLAGTRKGDESERAPEPVAPRPARDFSAPPGARDGVDRALATAAAEAPRFATRAPSSGWTERARDFTQTAIDSSMWIAAACLCAAGLVLGLTPPADAPAGATGGALQGSFAGRPIDVTMQRVESAVGGTLTVVRGHLPERAPSTAPTRVRARWTDAGGHPLAGDTAIVGPALPTSKLREHSLARVRALHEARAEEITRGGPFEAAFGAFPEGARGVALDVESAPAPEPAVAPVESTSGTEAAATASSPPAARPSSE